MRGNSLLTFKRNDMKKINLLLAFVLLFGNFSFAQTWDILDKSMELWNVDEGGTTNKAWSTLKGGTITVQSNEGYANVNKSGKWAWLRPTTAIPDLVTNTAYTVEVKVRLNSGDQCQISLRMNSAIDKFFAPIFLKYGDGVTGGSVSTVAGGTSNAYTLNTSDWQIYRLVLHPNHTNYDVYIDGINEPIIATGTVGSKTDQGGVYFGAETNQSCNLDIEYVKMGTGDFMAPYNASLNALSVSDGVLIPSFNPGVTEYVCELYNTDPNTVTLSATAAHGPAQVTGTGQVNLVNGQATSTVTVTSENGATTKTYKINYLKLGDNLNSLIVNNDFDYAAAGVAWNDNTNPNYPTFPDGTSTFISNCFRPVRTNITKIDTHAEFYGWQLSDWSYMFINPDETTPSQSMGIGSGNETFHSGTAMWIAGTGSMRFPNNFEFYQTIDKTSLSEGTYKVTCILGIAPGHLTSQRLFANQNVQFFGNEADYELNKTPGEIYSYAGYAPTGENDGKGLKVYVTIADGDSLKIGLRGGSYKGDGNLASTNNLPGWFKLDYFTLAKVNPTVASDATLSDISLSIGNLEFSPETLTYSVALPEGTMSVTPSAVSNIPDATITGTEEVDLSSNSGTSTIVVTALDGTTQKIYTINYSTVTKLDKTNESKVFCYADGRILKVHGVDSYTVYNVNGVRVANVNSADTSVELNPGVYIIKTRKPGAMKVIIK